MIEEPKDTKTEEDSKEDFFDTKETEDDDLTKTGEVIESETKHDEDAEKTGDQDAEKTNDSKDEVVTEESKVDAKEETKEEVKDEPKADEIKVEIKVDNETTAVTEETEVPVAEPDKYMLLKYLFRFVETRDVPLNPVLAGYFAKLLILLLNRKQKQIVPFIFSDECTLIENLIYHVYQKSVSEILQKILNVSS